MDASAPDPVIEEKTPTPSAPSTMLAVNNNNASQALGGGFSEQLLQYASMTTEFASWKDFLVHAGVNNAEMYGQVANAINLPTSLIPVGKSCVFVNTRSILLF